jgi:hypothetical protein
MAANRFNHLLSSVGTCHNTYAALMSSMLLIFVPQRCYHIGSKIAHSCSPSEALTNSRSGITFDKAVFAINIVTLCVLLVTERVIFVRESWLDKALEIDPSVSAANLSARAPEVRDGRSLLQEEPYIARRLLRLNLVTGRVAQLACVFSVLNTVVSGVLILRFNSDGLRSVTTLLTNSMLILPRMLRAAIVCMGAATHHGRGGEAISLYKRVLVNFNLFSPEYIESEHYQRKRDTVTWDEVLQEETELEEKSKHGFLARQHSGSHHEQPPAEEEFEADGEADLEAPDRRCCCLPRRRAAERPRYDATLDDGGGEEGDFEDGGDGGAGLAEYEERTASFARRPATAPAPFGAPPGGLDTPGGSVAREPTGEAKADGAKADGARRKKKRRPRTTMEDVQPAGGRGMLTDQLAANF